MRYASPVVSSSCQAVLSELTLVPVCTYMRWSGVTRSERQRLWFLLPVCFVGLVDSPYGPLPFAHRVTSPGSVNSTRYAGGWSGLTSVPAQYFSSFDSTTAPSTTLVSS